MLKSKKKTAETISIIQLLDMFPDDEACYEWLEEVRWNGTPTCPRCGGCERVSNPASKPHTYWCGKCRKNFTVTVGTIMHSTKTPLRNWMLAIYSVMTARKGVSAMQISKELGVQYKTAWYMLHRIREACKGSDLKLENVVEVDEAYIGGREGNKHPSKKLNAGRGPVGKTPLMGAKERDGRVIAKPVRNADMETANRFARDHIREGATIYTDDSRIYGKLPFRHDAVRHSAGEYVKGPVHTNSIESVWAFLKRSIHGTWHHVSVKHLHRYANEAAMRLNEGNVRIDTLDRMQSLVRNAGGKRIKYSELVS